MDRSDIGDRMKRYEEANHPLLPRRIPVLIRIDGRAFHTITRKLYGKGWSADFVGVMAETVKLVAKDIQGCNFAYTQSDEASFLLTDYRTISTNPWFDYDVQKLVSISASKAASTFTKLTGVEVCFDSRCFSLPQDDVCNYFIWRQIDATRNAIQMAGREHFSHKQLFQKTCSEIQEMLFQEKQINFNDYPIHRKRGFCIKNSEADYEIPIFSKDRDYVEKFAFVRED